MSLRVHILFPIEIINRELDFRLFQACLAARPNNRIFIGQNNTIYRVLKSLRGGIYVGKNIRPSVGSMRDLHMHRYQTMKQNGFILLHLDEEGGVMAGDEERWKQWLHHRLDVKCLAADDHVCTWGNWQQYFYQAQEPVCKDNITTTGHPRFDLYKKENRKYFEAEANKIRERYGDFILINTNFAWANHARHTRFIFSKPWGYEPENPTRRMDHVNQWGFTWRVLSGMVELVTRLSVEMPHLNYVFRPHPSENLSFYQTIFSDVQNVHVMHEGSVGAWLLASKAMIHDGCTTAIEAHFSDVPIINYKSVRDSRYDLMLPNLLGTQCSTEDEVLAEIQRLSQSSTLLHEDNGVNDLARSLIHNFEHDSFAAFTNRILELTEKVKPSGEPLSKVAAGEGWRSVINENQPGRKNRRDRFYGFYNASVPQKMETIQSILNKEIRYTLHSDELLSIEC
jgi:surface carbohydrate biosynthesis protein